MITIDPMTLRPNLPSEGQPSWFFIAVDLDGEARREWAAEQAASAAGELDLGARENGQDVQDHLAAVFFEASAAPRPEGFSARVLFIPDTSTWGLTIDFVAFEVSDDAEDREATHRMLTSADEDDDAGSYLVGIHDAQGTECGLLRISVVEQPLVEFEGGGAIVPVASLTCVIRRPDGQGAVVDLVGICVTQDVALLALAPDPLKNLMLGNELVTE